MNPKNRNSAVPFTDYLALVGCYADDVLEHKLIDEEL